MSKRYIHTVDDDTITDAAGFKAVADTNPAAYPVGAVFVLANGTALIVTANDGDEVTLGTIGVS